VNNSDEKLEYLYFAVKEMCQNTISQDGSKFGISFVNKCGPITHAALNVAKQMFNSRITISIGYIQIEDNCFFRFSKDMLEDWKRSQIQSKYTYHCWLSLDDKPFLDLTLAETMYCLIEENEKREFLKDRHLTYIGKKEIKDNNIIYHEIDKGDDVLKIFIPSFA